ncbi:tRNA (adenosine(37)-N6)-threonylcarbamoyltransferase complex dimerization subunit type 1 TsaB [Aquabacterium sp.]|uniref:tRNA (adenosine(37)-N6)-threonylcarbamoyltransferase complex dimerization subunit type 1 TsaB n=1 Tax=Aquabacterium sp. TaxID=1872578 RepID=UPI0027B9BF92|nr:tRNA (adenosine(37)-N6)-threonylcarbamoyltransferase complex dimerization subunit type 1 TsaB [Aquabacterium sp.]
MSVAAPVLLALDTAIDRVHAALAVGAAVQALDLPGGAQASAQLLPALQGLLRDAGLTWSDLDAIAFGSGPGAFTGLRTACSVTQGLALGADCPVIVLDTLMAVAEDARQQAPQDCAPGDTVWVLQDARMEELYVGAFTWDGADWQVAQAAQLWPLTEPIARWAQVSQDTAKDLHLCGNALQAYPDRFATLWPLGVTVMGETAAPRGGALLALAQRAWARGDTVDVALALPRYVRDKVAQTTAERRAIAQAPRHIDRLMTEADIPAVLEMEQAACVHPVHAWTEDNYRSSLRSGYWMRVRCEVDGGRIVAVCVAMDGVDEIHLLNIAVARAQQGQGIARALLGLLYERCLARQASLLWLEVRPSNERACALYIREGFVEVGRRKGYYPAPDGREDALVMRRNIDLGGPARAVD